MFRPPESTWEFWRSWTAAATWMSLSTWAQISWATIGTLPWPLPISANPDRPIAEALLDQRVMAGVGNVYSNELCFLFGRLPTSPVSSLRDPLRVVTRARDMLWANRLRWSRTTTGDTRPSRALWVYGRVGEPCRRCGTPISRGDGPVGERISYWCQACQR